jgi:hypothetical protein
MVSAWRGWLRAAGIVALLFVGVVLHGAEFFVADGIRPPEQPASSAVRAEPLGVVPTLSAIRHIDDQTGPLASLTGGGPVGWAAGVAVAVPAAGVAVSWFLLRTDRQAAASRPRSTTRAGRAPPAPPRPA